MEKLTKEQISADIKDVFNGLSISKDSVITIVVNRGVDYGGEFINAIKKTKTITEGEEHKALIKAAESLFNAVNFDDE